eukprot:g14223.t1
MSKWSSLDFQHSNRQALDRQKLETQIARLPPLVAAADSSLGVRGTAQSNKRKSRSGVFTQVAFAARTVAEDPSTGLKVAYQPPEKFRRPAETDRPQGREQGENQNASTPHEAEGGTSYGSDSSAPLLPLEEEDLDPPSAAADDVADGCRSSFFQALLDGDVEMGGGDLLPGDTPTTDENEKENEGGSRQRQSKTASRIAEARAWGHESDSRHEDLIRAWLLDRGAGRPGLGEGVATRLMETHGLDEWVVLKDLARRIEGARTTRDPQALAATAEMAGELGLSREDLEKLPEFAEGSTAPANGEDVGTCGALPLLGGWEEDAGPSAEQSTEGPAAIEGPAAPLSLPKNWARLGTPSKGHTDEATAASLLAEASTASTKKSGSSSGAPLASHRSDSLQTGENLNAVISTAAERQVCFACYRQFFFPLAETSAAVLLDSAGNKFCSEACREAIRKPMGSAARLQDEVLAATGLRLRGEEDEGEKKHHVHLVPEVVEGNINKQVMSTEGDNQDALHIDISKQLAEAEAELEARQRKLAWFQLLDQVERSSTLYCAS